MKSAFGIEVRLLVATPKAAVLCACSQPTDRSVESSRFSTAEDSNPFGIAPF